jgi:hypothetical protein
MERSKLIQAQDPQVNIKIIKHPPPPPLMLIKKQSNRLRGDKDDLQDESNRCVHPSRRHSIHN